LVEPRDGRVISAGNLAGWEDLPLRAILSRELGVSVAIDQDANTAALGERWRGCATNLASFVFLALGTGIGAGIILDGQLHRGFHSAAGEVGNFIVGREFLGRDRKGHGNLEMLIGSPAIKRRARQQVKRDLSAADAIDRADDDRRLAREAERIADYVSIAVINIAALLDPEAIVFGGGTAAAGEELIGRVRERVTRELAHPPALVEAVLGEDAQVYGALYRALESLDPELVHRLRTV
jgi:glucokinase